MITNALELKVAVRNLNIFEESLRALRDELTVKNPPLLEVTSKAYVRRIAALRAEIAVYRGELAH
jgi:hypothetical protein